MKFVTLNDIIIQYNFDTVIFLSNISKREIENLLNYMIHNYHDNFKGLMTTINKCVYTSNPTHSILNDLIVKSVKPHKDFTLHFYELNSTYIKLQYLDSDNYKSLYKLEMFK